MFEQHEAFIEPDEEAIIWRYLDFPKFVSMLLTKSLYFSRIDLLNDPMEGAIQRKILEDEAEEAEKKGENKKAEIIRHNLETTDYFTKNHLIPSSYVNCWRIADNESMGMWSQYVNGYGVAIKSNYRRLKQVLTNNEKHTFRIGLVKYLDYSRGKIPFGNAFNYILHKRVFFSDENEIRAVITEWNLEQENKAHDKVWAEVEDGRFAGLKPYLKIFKSGGDIVFQPDEREESRRFRDMLEEARNVVIREENPRGLKVEVNIKQLIEAVYTVPNIQQWFFNIVQQLVGMLISSEVNVLPSGVDEQV